MQEIQETTEYDVFDKHHSNRPIDEAAMRKLIQAIENKNMLKNKPIVVDKDLKIIDGQHRLEAARRLQIPIYYVVDESLDSKSMYLLNSAQKVWTLADYLNYYIGEGKEEYIKLDQFVKKEKIALNISFQLLNGTRNGNFFQEFKGGNYRFPNPQEYLDAMEKKERIADTIEYIRIKTSGNKMYLSRVAFYSALVEFFNVKSFDYATFRTKLQYKLDYLRPCTRQTDYVKMFKDIYNWKNKDPMKETSKES